MRWRFWLALGALALALALLAPALTPLSGSMDAFSSDLANGTFRPFGEFGSARGPGLSFTGALGGSTGNSNGNYLPGSADVPQEWLLDRNGNGGHVVIDEVFDPGLGAMKRLKAYDRVESDGSTLAVADARLRPVAADSSLRYDRILEAGFPVSFHAGEPIPIYSPHPKATIDAISTDPHVSVTFFRDGADTLYAISNADKVVSLNLTFRVSNDYYSFDARDGQRVSGYRYSQALPQPVVPAKVAEDAKLGLARAGVKDAGDVTEVVTKLSSYFRSFTEGPIPQASAVESLYLALAMGEHGCCRHRAFAFMLTAQSVGIPSRVVVNEAHAFVEVATIDGHWHQINLGGCGTYTLNDPQNRRSLFEAANDPRHEANPDEGTPTSRVVTFTNITQSPERIVKGEVYFVNGTVQASDGRGVPGARVDLFLNETKTTEGRLTGAGTTGPDGRFSLQARVPAASPARGYQLVARAGDGQQGVVRYAESWSDPPVQVFAPTRFLVVPVQAAVGFPANVTGRIADTDGNGVPNATVHWAADGVPQPDARGDATGRFTARITFDAKGAHVIDLRFDGTQNHGPANATVPVTVGTGAILLPAEAPILIRGERGVISGQLAVQGAPVGGREVLAILSGVSTSGTTDTDGTFAVGLDVPRGMPTGIAQVRVVIASLNLTATTSARVADRPLLALQAPAALGPRDAWSAAVTLTEADGTPMVGVPVDLGLDGVDVRTLLTNRTGVAIFDIAAGDLSEGSHRVRASFAGDASHVEVSTSSALDVNVPWYAKIPAGAYAGTLAVLVLVVLALPLLRRGGPVRRAFAWVAAHVRRPERWFLSVAFPDHPPGVLPVFEPGESAHVKVVLRDREGRPVDARLALVLDGVRTVLRAQEGAATFTSRLEREGEVAILASATGIARLWTQPLRARLRVESYRRAVENGFVDLRRRAGLPTAATPGDLVAGLARRLPGDARRSLSDAASLFDEADYSERPVDRAFYHAFARAAALVRDELQEVVDGAS